MTLRALALLAIVLLCALDARAAEAVRGGLRVSHPDAVAEGQPFLVEISQAGGDGRVTVNWLDKSAPVVMERKGGVWRGAALLGAGLGTAGSARVLTVEASGETVLAGIAVKPSSFPEQRLKLPPRMVTPSREDQERIKREREVINKALAETGAFRYWDLPFARPVPGVVTSAFGLRRVLNGQPRSPHTGIDFDAQTGDAVVATARGRVILTGDFYYNGNSVFLDHGQGVITMYFHLSRVDVAQGQMVEKGRPVGLAGSSGRATGPHLHFGMRLVGQAVDPMALFPAGGAGGIRPGEGS